MLIFIPQMCTRVYGNEKSEYFLQIHFKPKNLHFLKFLFRKLWTKLNEFYVDKKNLVKILILTLKMCDLAN